MGSKLEWFFFCDEQALSVVDPATCGGWR